MIAVWQFIVEGKGYRNSYSKESLSSILSASQINKTHTKAGTFDVTYVDRQFCDGLNEPRDTIFL